MHKTDSSWVKTNKKQSLQTAVPTEQNGNFLRAIQNWWRGVLTLFSKSQSQRKEEIQIIENFSGVYFQKG